MLRNNLKRFLVVVLLSWLYAGAAGAQAYIVYNEPVPGDQTLSAILTYIEGTFGAMVMVGCGIIGLVLLCFKRWGWASLSLGLAIAAFVLRSMVATFFNDANIRAAVPARLPALAATVEDRLLKLAELRQKGLIGPEEYAAGRLSLKGAAALRAAA